jgi:hypothetical protein
MQVIAMRDTVVDQLGARIRVRSMCGRGATFCVFLPGGQGT